MKTHPMMKNCPFTFPLVEITAGEEKGHIGHLTNESPLFDEVTLIVNGCSAFTRTVIVPKGSWSKEFLDP